VRRRRRVGAYVGHAIWREAQFGGGRSGSGLAGARARAILAEAGAQADKRLVHLGFKASVYLLELHCHSLHLELRHHSSCRGPQSLLLLLAQAPPPSGAQREQPSLRRILRSAFRLRRSSLCPVKWRLD
jgi:hypothetical protein